jgi:hypothetical protein
MAMAASRAACAVAALVAFVVVSSPNGEFLVVSQGHAVETSETAR